MSRPTIRSLVSVLMDRVSGFSNRRIVAVPTPRCRWRSARRSARAVLRRGCSHQSGRVATTVGQAALDGSRRIVATQRDSRRGHAGSTRRQRPGTAFGHIDAVDAERQRRNGDREFVETAGHLAGLGRRAVERWQRTEDLRLGDIRDKELAAIREQPPIGPGPERTMFGQSDQQPVGPDPADRCPRNPGHGFDQPARVVEPHREVVALEAAGDRRTHRRGGDVLQIAAHFDALGTRRPDVAQPSARRPARAAPQPGGAAMPRRRSSAGPRS